MKYIDLNGKWKMREVGNDEYHETIVPGSVASALLANGKMDDPYYRDNEEKIQLLFEKEYEFARDFNVLPETLSHDKVLLRCDGLDTLATVKLNGKELGKADNMHRVWVFDVKSVLREGKNTLSILFDSPVRYLKDHPSKTGRAFAVIRKAACMFGWDWGLNLPDSGIWRDICVETFDCAKIEYATIRQCHARQKATLKIALHADIWGEGVEAAAELFSPEGFVISKELRPAANYSEFSFQIENPLLWWPVGCGEQPLYRLKIVLKRNGEILDEKIQDIGLRTITLNREKKADGSNYGFVVNGLPIFFKGENMVIEDAVISRTTNERWDRLINNCIRSNLNGIRVWGGAYYPPDYFYEQCDRRGLLVWQDLMFAYTFYIPDDVFLENVRLELKDNLTRIAHHPCIALLCGNNEVESLYTAMSSKEPETVALRKLFGKEKRAGFFMRRIVWKIYSKLFLEFIPPLCEEYAPETDYVHSSPSARKPRSAKSFYDYLKDGDMHYYLQYNGNAPYQKMRTVQCRFMTEMGFQSYPSMKTIAAFSEEADRSPYSEIMYAHQKCKDGNEAIELYMERDYCIPADFADYVYLSQLQAGEIMKYSVEHLRRSNGYCNGVILWQLNDCWPVVSWSGIDYFGRWKAQQYYTKRFYENVLLSAIDDDTSVGLWVTNNSPTDAECDIVWLLMENGGKILQEGREHAFIPCGGSKEYVSLNFSNTVNNSNKNNVYLSYHLQNKNEIFGQGTVLFCTTKNFCFQKPNIKTDIDDNGTHYAITLSANCFVKGIVLDTIIGDCIFSDNYFDLPDGESRTVILKKADVSGIDTAETLGKQLVVNNLNCVLMKKTEKSI